mmetsp:Transcript_46191/g.136506  ORF Transcript_46191/g.136506 Transcript_46191/m.136506 type:complete len:261 (+) Transcript_46191:58-840(+)
MDFVMRSSISFMIGSSRPDSPSEDSRAASASWASFQTCPRPCMLFRTSWLLIVAFWISASAALRRLSASARATTGRKPAASASPSGPFNASTAVSAAAAMTYNPFAPSLLLSKSVNWTVLSQASVNLALNLVMMSKSSLRKGSLPETGSHMPPRSFSACRTTVGFAPRAFRVSVLACCSLAATGLPASSSSLSVAARPSAPVRGMPAISFASLRILANGRSVSHFRLPPSTTASVNDFRMRSSVVPKAAASRAFSSSYLS